MKKYCPCGTKRTYKTCCGPYHLGNLFPDTAESLMRSRYSAYVLNKPQYIYRTWHEDTRPTLQSLRLTMTGDEYTNLAILKKDLGAEQDEMGTVTFAARYAQEQENIGGNGKEYTETSSFKRINKRWVYVKGSPILR